MAKRDEGNDYSRREFLKYLEHAGIWAAFYGGLGGLAGYGLNYYGIRPINENIVEPVRRGKEYFHEKVIEPVRRTKRWIKNKITGRGYDDDNSEKEVIEVSPLEREVTRRGFLKDLFRYPKTAGTVAGALYGGSKYAIQGYPRYQDRKTIAQLRDDNARLMDKLDETQKSIEYLTDKIGNLSPHKEEKQYGKDFLLLFGAIGLIVSIITSSFSLTGFSVISSYSPKSYLFSPAVFLISLCFVLVGLRRNNFIHG